MHAFRVIRRSLGAGSLALLLGGCGATHLATSGETAIAQSAISPTPRSPSVRSTSLTPQIYTPANWPESLTARVRLPETPNAGLRPAALIVHGGGWRGRSPADMEKIARQLAGQGYVTVNVEYRFAPRYRFPAQLHDLQQAMRWIHDNAERLEVDTDRIVGVGYSSGAHLVSLLALASQTGPLAEPYGGEHTRLRAAAVGGLPSDLLKFNDGELVIGLLGGTRDEVYDAYVQASPIRQLTPKAPPFFLFHGNRDRLVPVDHARDFYEALRAQGTPAELYLQHGRGHIAAFLLRGGAVDAAIAFLNREVNRKVDNGPDTQPSG
ncbi:alpha/beta hydrolase [Halomonas sp. PAMB 3264]|uniref:alpha/beta hydrolase n=1 Tax=Halomonas sp. PAMB 3264 TaxID=3075222 RepID=UPI002898C92B|nr:alpha/beta hydrolase [Halomonas sp. PAMB 3264]WNL41615.1 alpha/beta hydrolase [Halomonas sp. PAMB 3264]